MIERWMRDDVLAAAQELRPVAEEAGDPLLRSPFAAGVHEGRQPVRFVPQGGSFPSHAHGQAAP